MRGASRRRKSCGRPRYLRLVVRSGLRLGRVGNFLVGSFGASLDEADHRRTEPSGQLSVSYNHEVINYEVRRLKDGADACDV